MDRRGRAGLAKVPLTASPKNAIEDAPVVHSCHATGLVRQHRLNGSPFMVGKFIAHDSKPLVWQLESQARGYLNAPVRKRVGCSRL